MDPIEGSVEVTNLICTTLLFIHNVTNPNASSSPTPSPLLQTHSFLQTFSDIAFAPLTGLLRDLRTSQILIQDIQRSLHALNKSLAAHREAWRNIGIAAKLNRQQTVRQRASTLASAVDVDGERKRWRDEMKLRSEIWRERAAPGVHAALFEEEEMEALLTSCSRWVKALRSSLCVVLLGTGSEQWPSSAQAKELGISRVLEHQRRKGRGTEKEYGALRGRLRKLVPATQSGPKLMKTVYFEAFGDESDVLVEVRPYTEYPCEEVRQLAWKLDAGEESTKEAGGERDFLALQSMGYIDDAANARSLMIYRSPRSHPWASDPPSLHELIRKGWAAKLSLGQRVVAARTLASTVLDIHTCGSIHGNITSHNIVMLSGHLNDIEPSPFLYGWAINNTPTRQIHSLEQNLYRHGAIFGAPSEPVAPSHDIYSLGIVLLEIGLWTTMNTVFAKISEKTPNFSAAEGAAIYRRISRTVLDLVGSPELKREMGGKFAGVVLACLKWPEEGGKEADTLVKFRREVVGVLAEIAV